MGLSIVGQTLGYTHAPRVSTATSASGHQGRKTRDSGGTQGVRVSDRSSSCQSQSAPLCLLSGLLLRGQGPGGGRIVQRVGRAQWKGSRLSCPVFLLWAREGQAPEPKETVILLELLSGEQLQPELLESIPRRLALCTRNWKPST